MSSANNGRYPGAEALVQAELRKAQSERLFRVSVVQAAIGKSRTTTSSAMAAMARNTHKTGLVKSGEGLYRYFPARDPGHPAYNGGAKSAPAPAPAPEPAVQSAPARRSRPRATPQRDVALRVLRYFQEHHDTPMDASHVADVLKARHQTVRVACNKWAAEPGLPQFEMVVGGVNAVFKYTPTDQERGEQSEVAAAVAEVAERAAQELVDEPEEVTVRELVEDSEPIVLEPEPVRPTPRLDETVQRPAVEFTEPEPAQPETRNDNMFLGQRLYEVEPGKWLVQLEDGSHKWLQDIR